jgi:hypothetical protein
MAKQADKFDGAQRRCLARLNELHRTGRLARYAARRVARLLRNAPLKHDAWCRGYGLGQAVLRQKLRAQPISR